MDMSNRTPLAWLRSQRQETRRPWQGTGPAPTPASEIKSSPTTAAKPKAPVALATGIVTTLLG